MSVFYTIFEKCSIAVFILPNRLIWLRFKAKAKIFFVWKRVKE